MAKSIHDEFLYAVAAGIVPGHSAVRKWGNNSDIGSTEEDVWSAGGAYAFPSDSGTTIEVVSGGADTAQITIEGLDFGFNIQKATITLNGTTPVAVPGTWTRVNRAYNSNSAVFSNTVTVRESGAGDTYAHLSSSHQQTSQAIYTVPSGHTGLILDANVSVNRTGAATLSADFFLNTREFGKVFRKKWHVGVQKDGSSHIKDNMILPEKLIEKTDIKMSGIVDTTAISGSAWFYILLLNNNLCRGISSA